MPATPPAPLSYDVFVSDGPPRAGAERMPDGSPLVWSPLSSTLISGAQDAVLVDPPFTRTQTQRVGDWVEKSGKRLACIYVTHGHGDHWFGTGELARRFPGVTVYATAGTIEVMRQQAGQGREQLWDRIFPGQIPETPVLAEPVPAQGFWLEGNPLVAVETGHSDTDHTTVLHVPAIGLVAAGDVAWAVDLIASRWFGFVDSGQVATVRGWMRSLGDNQIAAHALAAHSAAWVAALSGEQGSVRRWLPIILAGKHDGPLPDGMRSLDFSAALLGGAFGFDGIRAMRESAARAVELEHDPMSRWYALAQTALGFSLFLSGEPGAAEPLRKAIMSEASVPLARIMALSVASLVATEEGRIAQARELASAAQRLSDDGDLSSTPQYSLAHTAVGAVHVLEGRFGEARTEFERSLRSRSVWPGLSPWPTLETLLRLASLLLDTGDRAEAAVLLDEARNILTSLPDGAEAQLSRLEGLEQRIATRQSRVISPSDTLTEREVAVLHLLGGTLSLREIGQELHLSQNTIKTHTQAIYRKLGVSTRHAAVEKGRETGVPLIQISLSSLARRTASPRRAADSLR